MLMSLLWTHPRVVSFVSPLCRECRHDSEKICSLPAVGQSSEPAPEQREGSEQDWKIATIKKYMVAKS